MNIFSLAAAVLAAGPLLACSGVATEASTDASALATPLLQSCAGSYVCAADGSSDTTDTTLQRDGEACAAGTLLFQADNTVTDGDHKKLGTWKGDSLRFDICADDGCLHCKSTTAAAATPAEPADATGGSCTGSTSCSGHSPGDCGSLRGCSMDSHAHYFNGQVSYYDNYCVGSTPRCKDHETKGECEAQECHWE